MAWWVGTWDGFGERTAEENHALRERLFARGEYDGYLMHEGDTPVAWCQVGPRDRLEKLTRQFDLEADPAAWAITCFLVVPEARGRGLARELLEAVLEDLPGRGAQRVEAFPRLTDAEELDEMDLWNGPRALFEGSGFEHVRTVPPRCVLGLELGSR